MLSPYIVVLKIVIVAFFLGRYFTPRVTEFPFALQSFCMCVLGSPILKLLQNEIQTSG